MGAIHQCRNRFYPLVELKGDFIHQHDAVLDEHAYQSQCTHDCHEVERLVCKQHHSHHSHKQHGQTAEDDNRLAVVLEQHDKDGNHQDDGKREVLEQILHGLVAGALLSLPMQGIALRKFYLFYPTGDNLPCLFGLPGAGEHCTRWLRCPL